VTLTPHYTIQFYRCLTTASNDTGLPPAELCFPSALSTPSRTEQKRHGHLVNLSFNGIHKPPSAHTCAMWPYSSQQPWFVYGVFLTAPFAIQRPAAIRIRNTTLVSLHVVGMGPMGPEKSASPCGLSGTNGVSIAIFRVPAPQTSVPIT
jgi:hypothetical protein